MSPGEALAPWLKNALGVLAPSQNYISPWVCVKAVPDVLQGTLLILLACMATATQQLSLRVHASSACTAFKHMYVV